MEEYNSLRWVRLEEVGVEFSYIKSVVKDAYEYPIKENTIQEFRENIKSYIDIDECKLLNLLEDETYKKASIFSIKQYKKNKDKVPIIEDVTNDTFNVLFKEKNDINFTDGEYYNGKLDDCFKIIYYSKEDEFVTIKMACVISEDGSETLEDGTTEEYDVELYDCCKFIIDINNRLVMMFHNDIKSNIISISKQVTIKKTAFRTLFSITTKNIIKYVLNGYLEKYFNEYMKEQRAGNLRKLVSIIEASAVDNDNQEKSLIRSVKRDYVHSKKRLDAIEDAMENEKLTISEIECSLDDVIIDLQMKGDISCINSFLYKEVVENVSKEFFNGYKLS
ncbi:hypothetical protein [Clostridium saccharoperbutylacetonicum]